MTTMTTIAAHLKSRRLELGFTQAYVAEQCSMSRKLYNKFEKHACDISALRLIDLCNFLRVNVSMVKADKKYHFTFDFQADHYAADKYTQY